MKLHLPKLLLTAVLATYAACMTVTASTGWGSNNGNYLYVGGSKGGDGIDTSGVGNVTWDDNQKKVSIDSVNAVTKNWQNFGIVSDITGTPVQGTISELVVKNEANIKFCENPWRNGNTFSALTISKLEVSQNGENPGKVSINNEIAGNNISIIEVSGVLSSVTNAGTLSIGETGGTTYLSGNLTNTGTQTFEGNVTFVGAGPGNGNTGNTGFVITNAGTTTFKNGVISANVEGGILLSVQNGANVVVGGGDTVTTMELKQLRLHDGSTSTTEVFTIKDNAIVNITGNDTGDGTGKWAVVLGHWHYGTSKLNVEGGKLNVLNGTIKLGGDSNSEMNITGGTVNAKAITFDTSDEDDILNLDGGRLNIGSGGISHENYSDRFTLKLTSGTLGALAEDINITNVPTTIGGQFAIDTAIVNAEGEKTGAVASISFTNGVTMTSGAELTVKGGGSVSFGSQTTVTNTITVTALDNTQLEFGDIRLDLSEWTPDRMSKIYTEDGATVSASGNGFILDSSDYLLFDGYEWEGNVINSGFTVTTRDGDTYVVADKVLGSVYYVNAVDYEIDGGSSFVAQQATSFHVAAGKTLTIAGATDNASVSELLVNSTGEGNITLSTNVQLGENDVTKVKGSLTIGESAQLNLGNGDFNNNKEKQEASLSSFNSIVLDGGHIRVQNRKDTWKNVTVTEKGATLHINDLANSATDILTFAQTTTLNGNLTMTNDWGERIVIEKLCGTGSLIIDADADGRADIVNLSINGADDYQGKVQVKKTADKLKLSVAANAGVAVEYYATSGTADLTGIAAGNSITLAAAAGGITSGTIAADVVVKNTQVGNNLKAGMEMTTATDNTAIVYTGKFSGDGNYIIGAEATTSTTFSGDTSEFTGQLRVSKGVQNITFTGDATAVNNSIAVDADATANVTLNHAKAATVTKEFSSAGTLNLTVSNSSAEGVTFTNTVTTDTTTLEAGTKATFNGTTDLGDLTLAAGASVTTSGALTLGNITLDLTNYEAGSYTLVSATGNGFISWNEEWTSTGTLTDGLTANVGFVGEGYSTLQLTIKEMVTSDEPITTTVTGVSSFEGGVLTLDVTVDDGGSFSVDGSDFVLVNILTEDIMKGITDAVGSTKFFEIVLNDGVTDIKGGDNYNVGFLSENGCYYGEQVQLGEGIVAWQYSVEQIPEPASATLSLAALMMLCARRRRRA